MDVLLHPAEEREEVAFRESRGGGLIFHGSLKELGGVDIAQRVSGEVSDSTHGPVDVLKTAFGISLGSEAEEFFELVIPCSGDVGDF